MRIAPVLALPLALLLASSLAAQEADAPTLHPHPDLLAPPPASAEAPAVEMQSIETGGVTGLLVGALLGGLYGAFLADACGVEDDCTLSREVKAMSLLAIGSGLGGVIGVGMSLVLRESTAAPAFAAPLSVSPAPEGGVRVGVSLRH